MSTFVLVPGMWLGGWAWDGVATRLRDAGHEVHPLTLTGVGERAAEAGPGADLERHVSDITGLIEERDLRDVVLVAHSYGGLPVTAAAARVADRVARVIYVESGPLPDGARQIDMLGAGEEGDPGAGDPEAVADDDGATDTDLGGDLVPPPSWDAADDPVLFAGLDADAVALLRGRATPHPYPSVAQPLRRGGELKAPLALVACTFSLEQIEEMRAQGHPFFAGLVGADIHPLPTGHWPMLSEPDRLAETLDRIAHS